MMSDIASIAAHRTFAFRVAPYNVSWSYTLRTHVDDTYGGKVVQILGVNLGDLSLDTVTGSGGRAEVQSYLQFFREMSLWQQNTQQMATFSYPKLGYTLSVWAKSITIQDALENVVFPIQMTFMIQEELGSQLTKTSMRKELEKLASGIGYARSIYNYPGEGAIEAAAANVQKGLQIHLPGITLSQGGAAATGSDSSLSTEQQANAKAIFNVAASRGLGTAGEVMGIMVAITESTLVNVPHGDLMGPSSRGLFQQMPGWGPLSVRMDPAGSAGLFFDALAKVNNWQSLPPWKAAQAVQQSEFSDGSNYQKNYSWAQQIVAKLSG